MKGVQGIVHGLLFLDVITGHVEQHSGPGYDGTLCLVNEPGHPFHIPLQQGCNVQVFPLLGLHLGGCGHTVFLSSL